MCQCCSQSWNAIVDTARYRVEEAGAAIEVHTVFVDRILESGKFFGRFSPRGLYMTVMHQVHSCKLLAWVRYVLYSPQLFVAPWGCTRSTARVRSAQRRRTATQDHRTKCCVAPCLPLRTMISLLFLAHSLRCNALVKDRCTGARRSLRIPHHG